MPLVPSAAAMNRSSTCAAHPSETAAAALGNPLALAKFEGNAGRTRHSVRIRVGDG
jgi:hypothetical protein